MNRSTRPSPVRQPHARSRSTGQVTPGPTSAQPSTQGFSHPLTPRWGQEPSGQPEGVAADRPLPDAATTGQANDALHSTQPALTDRLVDLANAHLAIAHPAQRLELMDRLTDLVPDLQTLVDVEALLTVIDAAQPLAPHLPLHEALFARVAQLVISTPDAHYLDVASHLPQVHGVSAAVVRSQYLADLLDRLVRALAPLGPIEQLIAIKAYLAVARDDTAPWPPSCTLSLVVALDGLRGFLSSNPAVACAAEEAMYLHQTRESRRGGSVDATNTPPAAVATCVADAPNGVASPLTDLPTELTDAIVHLLHPDPFAVADRAGTAARIAALGRLSQVNHRFHAQLKDALSLALFSAFQLPSLALKAWRSSDRAQPAAVVHRYLLLNPSVSPIQCLRWLVAGALSQRTPLECTRALDLVQAIGIELQQTLPSPADRAAVARHLPVLLVHAVLKGLADTQEQSGRWVIQAGDLLDWLSHLPQDEAVPALLELLMVFVRPGDRIHAIRGDILSVQAKLAVEDVVTALRWPRNVASVWFQQMVCVKAVADGVDTVPGAEVVDATLMALSAHHFAFLGVMARALIALEKTPLTDAQSALLSQCLQNADARGPWRAFA